MIGERAMSKRTMHEEWETPASVFDPLHAEFGFTLDAAALPHNAKCERYLTPDDDALCDSWSRRGPEVIWLNPPYGHKNLRNWMAKAVEESARSTIVCLVPAHTGQIWWHESVIGKYSEIRWIKGKVKFVGAASCAPFPSCLVIYRRPADPPRTAVLLAPDQIVALDELRGPGDGLYYVTQERAMAPGIADGWPAIIQPPHTKNGRLVRRKWPAP